jgi:hypothetical protein
MVGAVVPVTARSTPGGDVKRILPLLSLLAVGCISPPYPTPPADPPPAPAVDTDYSKWPSVTDEPYEVPLGRILPCSYGLPSKEATHGPHSVHAIAVRVNSVGREAFLARTPVPVGTVVVKEKLADDKVTAVGTMTKREAGYDAEYGDWEYGYRELRTDAPPAASGRLDSCIACHRIAKAKDYLYRPYRRWTVRGTTGGR